MIPTPALQGLGLYESVQPSNPHQTPEPPQMFHVLYCHYCWEQVSTVQVFSCVLDNAFIQQAPLLSLCHWKRAVSNTPCPCTSLCGQCKVILKTTVSLMQRENGLKILQNNILYILFNGLGKNRQKMSWDTSYSPVFCTRGSRVAVGFVKSLALPEIALK